MPSAWTCGLVAQLDELAREVRAGRLGRGDVVHRLARHARGDQVQLDVRRQAAIGLPGVEHVDPDRPHGDLAAVQHVQGAGIARCEGDVLIERLQRFERVAPSFGKRGIVGSRHHLLGVAGHRIQPAHIEADAGHAALDAVIAELSRMGACPLHQIGIGGGRVGDQQRVEGDGRLAVEHRDHIAGHVGAQRVVPPPPR